MPNPLEDKTLILVPGLGAVGGLLAWMMSVRAGGPLWPDIIVMVTMGAGAALIFLFVIMNTDRSDVARLVALSLLAGFSWETVWEAGGAVVERHAEEARVAEIEEATHRIAEIEAELLSATDPRERKALASRATGEIERLGRVGSAVTSVDALQKLTEARVVASSVARSAADAGSRSEAKEIELAARRSLNPAQIVVPQADRRLELLVTDFDVEEIERAVREEARVAPPPPRRTNGARVTP